MGHTRLHGRVGSANSVVAAVKGVVRFWNAEKGWGFLQPHDASALPVFVHYSKLQPGVRNLVAGDRVEFDVIDADRKNGSQMAVNVRVIA
jgi:CspA family cold shock protein